MLAAGVIGVGGSIALGEIAQSTNNLVKGNYIDKTTGRTVNINDPEVRKAMDANPDNYRVKRGTAGEAWRGLRDRVWSGSDNLSGGAPSPESPRQPSDSSPNEPHHNSGSHKQNEANGIKNNETHHNAPPKSDGESISKSSGNNKFSTTPPAGGGHPKPPRAPSGNWKAGVAKYIVGMAASMGILNAAENTEYEETVTRAVDFASNLNPLGLFIGTSMGNSDLTDKEGNLYIRDSKGNIIGAEPKSALNDAYEKIRQDPNLFKSPEEEERQNIQEQETIAAREAAERTNRTLEEVSQTLEDQSRQLEEVKKNKTRIKFGNNK